MKYSFIPDIPLYNTGKIKIVEISTCGIVDNNKNDITMTNPNVKSITIEEALESISKLLKKR